MLKAFKASEASLVCLCSSDKVYASGGADAARQLREAGAKHIYLAGKPGELETELKSAGASASSRPRRCARNLARRLHEFGGLS
nr:hypothetical protein [Methyloceanibacter marginalis]